MKKNSVTRWLTPEKALIQLSLRSKFEDLLWFTFFHEAGHILLHDEQIAGKQKEHSTSLTVIKNE